jgi:hypothetical protein
MDRRVGRLALAVAAVAACGSGGGKPKSARDGGVEDLPVAQLVETPDAAPEIDAAPIRQEDVLVGPAAERAVAEQPREPTLAPWDDPDEPLWSGIRPDGYGPLRIGQRRAEVEHILVVPGALRKLRGKKGDPVTEQALLPGKDKIPYLKVIVHAGRLRSIEVVRAQPNAVTDEGVGVGATMAEAREAHGPARRVDDERTGAPIGWVLEDLPGVIWIPAGAGSLAEDAPGDADRVARILIVGPERTSPSD